MEISEAYECLFPITTLHSLDSQTNIRIDGQGTARIAGFASATIILQAGIALEDVDESVESNVSRWHGPEILRPGSSGSTKARATKASDMYAFGMLAYEVGPHFLDRTSMLLNLRPDFLGSSAVSR